MIQVLERVKYDHREIRYAPSKVSLEPLLCPGVGNLNNMPANMAISGRDEKNMLASDLSAAAIYSGGENFMAVFIFIEVYMKLSKGIQQIINLIHTGTYKHNLKF